MLYSLGILLPLCGISASANIYECLAQQLEPNFNITEVPYVLVIPSRKYFHFHIQIRFTLLFYILPAPSLMQLQYIF